LLVSISMSQAVDLVTEIRDICSAKGFDIVDPFPVGEYNKLATRHQVTTFGRSNNLGILIGSSKRFWDGFVSFVKSKTEGKDFVDDYAKLIVRSVMDSIQLKYDPLTFEVRMSSDLPITGRYIHIQTASHVSGATFYDQETFWSIHPVYGTWFVLRAAIIFDLDFSGIQCTPISDSPLQQKEKEKMIQLTKIAMDQSWSDISTLLEIRSVCSIGQDWKYSGLLLDYFYPIGKTREGILDELRKL